jgi:hypothetical protein
MFNSNNINTNNKVQIKINQFYREIHHNNLMVKNNFTSKENQDKFR